MKLENRSYHLIESVDRRGQTTMYTKYLIFNDSAERQVVENFRAIAPDIDASILPQAFIVKAIHLKEHTSDIV